MDYETLVVKNIPKTLKLSEYFKRYYNAIAVRYYGRARAVVRFKNRNDAKNALIRLHQSELDSHIISAEYLGRRELIKPDDDINKDSTEEKSPDFAKNILALSAAHGFMHPPPPHLIYSYPKINRDILDAISIALLSNPKFYTQVIHLMNRMNLEPPFLERKQPFIPPGELKNAQTQTEFEKLDRLLASDESEIEFSDEEQPKIKRIRIDCSRQDDDEKLRLKVKRVLKSQTLTKQTKNFLSISKHDVKKTDTVFESPQKNVLTKKISLNVASLKLPEKVDEILSGYPLVEEENKTQIEEEDIVIETLKERELTIEDLEENRIPENQLKEMPIYKNYQEGERSNKLYIKNLAKNVTVEDLKNIFKLFGMDNFETDLEIKLMQHGRMKGQAFVSFVKLNETKDFDIVCKALNSTNGFILKNKPMIVCFAKK